MKNHRTIDGNEIDPITEPPSPATKAQSSVDTTQRSIFDVLMKKRNHYLQEKSGQVKADKGYKAV